MKIKQLPKMDDNNGWLNILPPLPPPALAQGEFQSDFAIVGAGYAGLAAARRLGELLPDCSIVVLDAGRVGNNAAGRNSGFAIDQAHNIRAKDFAGIIDAEREQLSLNRAGQDYLREAVRNRRILCDWDEAGKIHAAATGRGASKLHAYAKALDLLGTEYDRLDAGQLKEITGSEFYISGLYTPGTILVQPAALVRGLAATLPGNVTLFEDSPVTEMELGVPHRLILPEATVNTRTLILANNGFAGQFGYYRKDLLPIATWGSLTRPLTGGEARQLGGRNSWGIVPADPFGTSVRRMIDGRILIRNIYSYNPGLNPEDRDRTKARVRHEASLRNRFPMLPDLDFDYTWGGPLCFSRNGEPVFGELETDVFGAFCLNGVGIARGTIYGKLLAELVAGVSTPLLDIMLKAGRPTGAPPQPFLGWGIRLQFAKRRHDAGLEM